MYAPRFIAAAATNLLQCVSVSVTRLPFGSPVSQATPTSGSQCVSTCIASSTRSSDAASAFGVGSAITGVEVAACVGSTASVRVAGASHATSVTAANTATISETKRARVVPRLVSRSFVSRSPTTRLESRRQSETARRSRPAPACCVAQKHP